jgi:hypothetical protein
MKRLNLLITAFAIALAPHFSTAVEFPGAPPNLKEAEALGLPRLSATELKTFFPGVIECQGTVGRLTLILNPDGTAQRRLPQEQKDSSGKWRFDEAKNAYCTSFWLRRGHVDNCFAVFRAKDGVHYFDYDVDNGFYTKVWRRAEGQ